jgi:hypothetical protein
MERIVLFRTRSCSGDFTSRESRQSSRVRHDAGSVSCSCRTIVIHLAPPARMVRVVAGVAPGPRPDPSGADSIPCAVAPGSTSARRTVPTGDAPSISPIPDGPTAAGATIGPRPTAPASHAGAASPAGGPSPPAPSTPPTGSIAGIGCWILSRLCRRLGSAPDARSLDLASTVGRHLTAPDAPASSFIATCSSSPSGGTGGLRRLRDLQYSQWFLSPQLAVGTGSWFIYHFTDSPLRRRAMTLSRIAPRQLEQALGRPDPGGGEGHCRPAGTLLPLMPPRRQRPTGGWPRQARVAQR